MFSLSALTLERNLRSLERVMALLEAVAMSGSPLTATAAAGQVDLALSSTSRLMREMSDVGVLKRLPEAGSYVLGVRMLAIAGLATSARGTLTAVESECEMLRDLTGETVSLHIRSGGQRICFMEVQSAADVRRVVKVGLTVPLHFGATGRVLLAGLPATEQDDYIAGLDLQPDRKDELRVALEDVARQGWLMAVDSWLEGVAGIAAPVRGHDGASFAVLTVSGPSYRWTSVQMSRHVTELMRTAERIASLYSGGRFIADTGDGG